MSLFTDISFLAKKEFISHSSSLHCCFFFTLDSSRKSEWHVDEKLPPPINFPRQTKPIKLRLETRGTLMAELMESAHCFVVIKHPPATGFSLRHRWRSSERSSADRRRRPIDRRRRHQQTDRKHGRPLDWWKPIAKNTSDERERAPKKKR